MRPIITKRSGQNYLAHVVLRVVSFSENMALLSLRITSGVNRTCCKNYDAHAYDTIILRLIQENKESVNEAESGCSMSDLCACLETDQVLALCG